MTEVSSRCKSKSTHSTFSSSGSDSSSSGEEERLRQLFLSCDSNQDGKLDSRDLLVMCQKLNMVELADEIILALGANVKGAISFEEFLRCRRKVMQLDGGVGSVTEEEDDEEDLTGGCGAVGRPLRQTQLDSSASDNSLVNSGAEYDSGAQDLSGEPHNIYRLLRDTYPDVYRKFFQPDGAPLNPSVSYLMECLNALHLSQITGLRTEARDLNNRLRSYQMTREVGQKDVYRLQKDKSRLKVELANQSARYEDRLTELHSVIAELQKKLDRCDTGVILEEDEEEEEPSGGGQGASSTVRINGGSTSAVADSQAGHFQRQVEGLRTSQAYLQEKISNYETQLDSMHMQMHSLGEEKELLRRQVKEMQTSDLEGTSSSPSLCGVTAAPQGGPGSPTRPLLGSSGIVDKRRQVHQSTSSDHQQAGPEHLLSSLAETYPQFAERCREELAELERRAAATERCRADRWLLQLSLEESKCTAGRLQCLLSQYDSNCGALSRANNAADATIEIAEVLVQLAESEVQLVLANCRAAGLGHIFPGDADHLPHQFTVTDGGEGHYANADTLLSTVAVNGGSSVHLTPQHTDDNMAAVLHRARCQRRQTESTARHLLTRLDGGGGGGGSSCSGGRHTPDSGAVSTVGSGGSGSWLGGCAAVWTRGDERRLRGYLDQLTGERALLRYSVVEVEGSGSSHGQSSSQISLPLSSPAVSSVDLPADNTGPPGYDLENAVLLQELCTVKEDRADLKARVYLLEKELRAALLKLESKAAAEQAYLVQVDHLKAELIEAGPNQRPPTTSSSSEARLKAQVQDLLHALEQLRHNTEISQQQSEEFANDLKRANASLIAAFEKAKRMYQTRIKKLEAQLVMTSSNSQITGPFPTNPTSSETAL